MRCLYCNKRLGVLRPLRGEPYCSEEHREQYQQDQSKAFAERLSHDESRSKGKPKPKAPGKPREDAPLVDLAPAFALVSGVECETPSPLPMARRVGLRLTEPKAPVRPRTPQAIERRYAGPRPQAEPCAVDFETGRCLIDVAERKREPDLILPVRAARLERGGLLAGDAVRIGKSRQSQPQAITWDMKQPMPLRYLVRVGRLYWRPAPATLVQATLSEIPASSAAAFAIPFTTDELPKRIAVSWPPLATAAPPCVDGFVSEAFASLLAQASGAGELGAVREPCAAQVAMVLPALAPGSTVLPTGGGPLRLQIRAALPRRAAGEYRPPWIRMLLPRPGANTRPAAFRHRYGRPFWSLPTVSAAPRCVEDPAAPRTSVLWGEWIGARAFQMPDIAQASGPLWRQSHALVPHQEHAVLSRVSATNVLESLDPAGERRLPQAGRLAGIQSAMVALGWSGVFSSAAPKKPAGILASPATRRRVPEALPAARWTFAPACWEPWYSATVWSDAVTQWSGRILPGWAPVEPPAGIQLARELASGAPRLMRDGDHRRHWIQVSGPATGAEAAVCRPHSNPARTASAPLARTRPPATPPAALAPVPPGRVFESTVRDWRLPFACTALEAAGSATVPTCALYPQPGVLTAATPAWSTPAGAGVRPLEPATRPIAPAALDAVRFPSRIGWGAWPVAVESII